MPHEHPQPAGRVQFEAGAVLQPSGTPSPLIEDEHEHEDDFDAPGRARARQLGMHDGLARHEAMP
jgi:hypothetical protein